MSVAEGSTQAPAYLRRVSLTEGVHNHFLAKYAQLSLDSGFRRNDSPALLVFPGKAAGRDPESRILLCTRDQGRYSFRDVFLKLTLGGCLL